MADDKPSYKMAHKQRHDANIVSPQGKSVGEVRSEIRKIPEMSGGAQWTDPKMMIHVPRDKNPSPDIVSPVTVGEPGAERQKT